MRLAVIPGDGIGLDVTEQALHVLDAVLPGVDATQYDLGAARWHRTGETLPDSVLAELRGHDAILLGAVGDPSVPSGVLERGLLLRLRFELDHHVNLRPAKLYPGVTTPLAGDHDIDFVVVREGTEGPYAGNGGSLRKGTPHEIATEVSVNTAYGVERVVRDAFARAAGRPRKHLTLVHKTNVLTNAGDLWFRTVERIHGDFPDVTTAYHHVDAATIYLVTDPGRYDVIVTDNLFGDILTDLAAAVAGGIGLRRAATSTSAAPTRRCSSPYTARHRTSPARARPTPPLRCSRCRCCSSTSVIPMPPRASRRQSPPTWPAATSATPARRPRSASAWRSRRPADDLRTRHTFPAVGCRGRDRWRGCASNRSGAGDRRGRRRVRWGSRVRRRARGDCGLASVARRPTRGRPGRAQLADRRRLHV
jgi:3-isopropylmalate dehydrogenase